MWCVSYVGQLSIVMTFVDVPGNRSHVLQTGIVTCAHVQAVLLRVTIHSIIFPVVAFGKLLVCASD